MFGMKFILDEINGRLDIKKTAIETTVVQRFSNVIRSGTPFEF